MPCHVGTEIGKKKSSGVEKRKLVSIGEVGEPSLVENSRPRSIGTNTPFGSREMSPSALYATALDCLDGI